MSKLTPMMQQYFKIKDDYPDCLLLYRLGDFYELFFEDAKIASQVLDLVLTGRDCGLEERAPMCGVPFHAVDSYINKLIKNNYKVAICEQLEDPSKTKGMVKRGVIRVITPGTFNDIDNLDKTENNYIVSIVCRPESKHAGFSYCDVSTGSFFIFESASKRDDIVNHILRINPKEILIPDSFEEEFLNMINKTRIEKNIITLYHDWAYDKEYAINALLSHFKVNSLSGYGCDGLNEALSSAGALIDYLHSTQKNDLQHINTIRVYDDDSNMVLDATAIRNLELTKTIIDGRRKGSLLWLLDKTKTSLGSRLLRQIIESPLRDSLKINNRLNAVEEIINDLEMALRLRNCFNEIYDLERLISRISYGSLNARDCLKLKTSVANLPHLKEILRGCNSTLLKETGDAIDPLIDMCQLIEDSIDENAGLSIREGGIIKYGYNSEIDELKKASEEGKNWLASLEAREREKTGINKLRVGYNKVFGYYIEVTNSFKDKVPDYYIGKQTLVNCERYITEELKSMESRILNAEEKQCEKEYEVFSGIRNALNNAISRIQLTSKCIALIDVLQSLAQVSFENNYVKPVITDDGIINIKNGRHPVIEKMSDSEFVPNDISISNNDRNVMLITGPNMAGKSTFMRQVGLITLMAHIGCYVPADEAYITLTDRIFTRVGASDDISSGQSTFMVEMNELANILNNATKNSLIILDEIGRGTSTTDGLAIAWATIDYIIKNIGAITLFATHYHELIDLENNYDSITNCSVNVRQIGNDIIFLHKIVPKGTDKSFGIEVASLAGLPKELVDNARFMLSRVSRNEININASDNENKNIDEAVEPFKDRDIINQIMNKIDLDTITPLEALNILNDIKKELN